MTDEEGELMIVKFLSKFGGCSLEAAKEIMELFPVPENETEWPPMFKTEEDRKRFMESE